ncbi:MAG: DNA-formamidopyrimidine glycosylase [Candidatus Margulisiibacteriota bacterium]|jgi:formamidopyrimidine-DNA glycosylase
MPELPEVETIRNTLTPHVKSQKIEDFACYLPKLIKGDLIDFKNNIIGATITDLKRRGKYLFLYLDNAKVMIVHLRLTGQLLWVDLDLPKDKHTHLEFYFTGLKSKLIYRDLRQFGQFELIDQSEVVHYIDNKKIATDALQITEQEFYGNLKRKKKFLKTILLDQSVIAGIGNIYADEVLFLEKLSPMQLASAITQDKANQLLATIKATLKEAIEKKGTSISDYIDSDGKKGGFQNLLHAYQKEGQPCFFCQEKIVAKKINGRNTRYCPKCQDL